MRLKETVRQWNTQWIDSRNQNYFIQHRSEYEIEKFRNIHESEDCFIIGNGPSLRPEDLDKIHELGYCSFASNKIYNIFKSTKWRPTYVTVSDPQFIRNKKILYNIEQIMPEMFFMRSQFAKDVKGLHCRTCKSGKKTA